MSPARSRRCTSVSAAVVMRKDRGGALVVACDCTVIRDVPDTEGVQSACLFEDGSGASEPSPRRPGRGRAWARVARGVVTVVADRRLCRMRHSRTNCPVPKRINTHTATGPLHAQVGSAAGLSKLHVFYCVYSLLHRLVVPTVPDIPTVRRRVCGTWWQFVRTARRHTCGPSPTRLPA